MSQSKADTVCKRIGDLELTIYRLDPLVSLKLGRKLLAILAPSVLTGIGKFGGVEKLLESAVDLGAAARELFDRLDDALLDELVQKFGEVSQAKGGWVKDTFSGLFRGQPEAVLEWLWFCLQNEYGGVVKKALGGTGLGDLSTLLQRFGSRPTSPSNTSSTDSPSGG